LYKEKPIHISTKIYNDEVWFFYIAKRYCEKVGLVRFDFLLTPEHQPGNQWKLRGSKYNKKRAPGLGFTWKPVKSPLASRRL
jgi:hypothetical protein